MRAGQAPKRELLKASNPIEVGMRDNRRVKIVPE